VITKLENRTPSGKSSRAAEHCAERATLSHAVSKAIMEAYLRKKAYEDAQAKGDRIVLWAGLQTSRDALARAVDALSKHLEEHCEQKARHQRRRIPSAGEPGMNVSSAPTAQGR
jgi:hypothetical protein